MAAAQQLQTGRAPLKPSMRMILRINPAAPGKGVHERHEKPHFKLFLTLVYTFLERAGYIAGLLGPVR